MEHKPRSHTHGKHELVSITGYTSQDVLHRFRVATAAKDKSMSEVIVSLIEGWLKRNEK